MRIAILSDLHLGFHAFEQDSYDNADEAMDKALDSDLIIIAGDIFDSRSPRTAVWNNAIRILIKPLLKSSGIRLIHSTKEIKEISKRTLSSIPVIAIHGTHERKGMDANAVETLENAGILIHLHKQSVVFEKNGVKVAIHGMSGVPERTAKTELEEWNPQPVPNCYNILVLHQSIDPFVYSPLEPPSIKLNELPRGFDVIIDGHIHGTSMSRINDSDLIIVGSTIVTQLEKSEAGAKKGIYRIDFEKNNKRIEFIPLENSREFFFEDVIISGSMRQRIEDVLRKILSRGFVKPPIVKMKIIGKESDMIDQELKDLERAYSDQANLIFVKQIESPEVMEKIEFLRNLREQKISIEEIGLNLLTKNLDELSFGNAFDHLWAFDFLSQNKTEDLFNQLVKS